MCTTWLSGWHAFEVFVFLVFKQQIQLVCFSRMWNNEQSRGRRTVFADLVSRLLSGRSKEEEEKSSDQQSGPRFGIWPLPLLPEAF
jgi:hypothetical protein